MFLPVMVGAQQSVNMTLLSNFDIPNLPVRYGAEYSDCWGYTSGGTNVAIIGGMQTIFFVNITNPASPVLIDSFTVANANGTTNGSLWRDFKTYQNYVYASADEGTSGLLIFDLSNVPVSVTLDTQIVSHWHRAHNIFIDEANGRLYAAGANTQSNGLKILDLAASPTNPPLIGSINLATLGGGYVHDVHVRDNIVYCSHGSLAKVQIYNMNNLNTISLIGIIDEYPEEGYNHSSWLSDDGTMLVMADETQGSDLKLVDVTDPLNISANDIHTFYSELEGPAAPGASVAHNPFIQGDLAYIAYYHDGIQVFNISDPLNITLLAYYDTYPENIDYVGYEGAWGVYPFFPGGIIIGSDQTNGLFVMQITDELLDINFISFDARRKDENVNLEWTVADASFGNRFEIEKSVDGGKTFVKAGTVKLIENESHYSFLDENVSPQQNYTYRISFVEFNGNRIHSPLRTISKGDVQSIIHVANPVSSALILDILQPIELLDLKMYDIEGRLTWSFQQEEPNEHLELNIANLIPGQYVLAMSWPGGAENIMVQVLK